MLIARCFVVVGFENSLLKDDRGLSTTEYLLILLGVVALAASAWSLFTESTSETSNEAGIAIRDMESRTANAALSILGQAQGVGGHVSNGQTPAEIGTLPEGAPSTSSSPSHSTGDNSNNNIGSDDVGGDSDLDNGDYFGYTGGGINVPPPDPTVWGAFQENEDHSEGKELGTGANDTSSFAETFTFEDPDLSDVNLGEGLQYSYKDVNGEGFLIATKGEGVYYQIDELPPGFPAPDSEHPLPSENWDLENGAVLVGKSPPADSLIFENPFRRQLDNLPHSGESLDPNERFAEDRRITDRAATLIVLAELWDLGDALAHPVRTFHELQELIQTVVHLPDYCYHYREDCQANALAGLLITMDSVHKFETGQLKLTPKQLGILKGLFYATLIPGPEDYALDAVKLASKLDTPKGDTPATRVDDSNTGDNPPSTRSPDSPDLPLVENKGRAGAGAEGVVYNTEISGENYVVKIKGPFNPSPDALQQFVRDTESRIPYGGPEHVGFVRIVDEDGVEHVGLAIRHVDGFDISEALDTPGYVNHDHVQSAQNFIDRLKQDGKIHDDPTRRNFILTPSGEFVPIDGLIDGSIPSDEVRFKEMLEYALDDLKKKADENYPPDGSTSGSSSPNEGNSPQPPEGETSSNLDVNSGCLKGDCSPNLDCSSPACKSTDAPDSPDLPLVENKGSAGRGREGIVYNTEISGEDYVVKIKNPRNPSPDALERFARDTESRIPYGGPEHDGFVRIVDEDGVEHVGLAIRHVNGFDVWDALDTPGYVNHDHVQSAQNFIDRLNQDGKIHDDPAYQNFILTPSGEFVPIDGSIGRRIPPDSPGGRWKKKQLEQMLDNLKKKADENYPPDGSTSGSSSPNERNPPQIPEGETSSNLDVNSGCLKGDCSPNLDCSSPACKSTDAPDSPDLPLVENKGGAGGGAEGLVYNTEISGEDYVVKIKKPYNPYPDALERFARDTESRIPYGGPEHVGFVRIVDKDGVEHVGLAIRHVDGFDVSDALKTPGYVNHDHVQSAQNFIDRLKQDRKIHDDPSYQNFILTPSGEFVPIDGLIDGSIPFDSADGMTSRMRLEQILDSLEKKADENYPPDGKHIGVFFAERGKSPANPRR